MLGMADKLSEYSSDSSETFGSAGSPPPTPSESFTTETTEKAPYDSQMVSAKQRRHTLEQKSFMKRERNRNGKQELLSRRQTNSRSKMMLPLDLLVKWFFTNKWLVTTGIGGSGEK